MHFVASRIRIFEQRSRQDGNNNSAVQCAGAENEDVHTIQRKGHCDAVVTELFARTLLPDANGAVCAACGIHFDNATKEQLRQIMDAVRKLLGDLQTQLSLNAREKME